MGHIPLSKTDDWKLEHKDQDIRGWEVRDANDRKIGKVDEMMVNTDTEYVDQILLEDGTTYPARDIHIGDRVVYVEGAAEGTEGVQPVVKVYEDYGRVQRSEDAGTATVDYDDDYREHYTTTFASSDQDYDVYEPAYRYGHESANDERYEGRSYEDVETDLNRSYGERYPDSRYDQVKDAVRYGYERARTGRGQNVR